MGTGYEYAMNHLPQHGSKLVDMLMEIEASGKLVTIARWRRSPHSPAEWQVNMEGALSATGRTLYEALCAMRGEPAPSESGTESKAWTEAEQAYQNAMQSNQFGKQQETVNKSNAEPYGYDVICRTLDSQTERLERLEAAVKPTSPQKPSMFVTFEQSEEAIKAAVEAERKRCVKIVQEIPWPYGASRVAKIEKGE